MCNSPSKGISKPGGVDNMWLDDKPRRGGWRCNEDRASLGDVLCWTKIKEVTPKTEALGSKGNDRGTPYSEDGNAGCGIYMTCYMRMPISLRT